MKANKLIIIVGCLVGCFMQHSAAQQEIQLTQYMDNMLPLNPAFAGAREVLSVTGIHREQWMGMNGRPRTSALSIHSPIGKSLGGGLNFMNDRIGPVNRTSITGSFAYKLRFKNSKSKLAFGVNGTLNILNMRTAELNTIQAQDPNLAANYRNELSPNFGFGIHYYAPRWFVGISAPSLLEVSLPNNTTGAAKERRHYFFFGGIAFKVNRDWDVRPAAQVKYTVGAPVSFDVSLAGIYRERVWIGANYRFGDNVGAFLQYQIATPLKAGIAYDFTISELAGYNRGSLEVLLTYDLFLKKDGVVTPRFF